jgi:hypothetical protein
MKPFRFSALLLAIMLATVTIDNLQGSDAKAKPENQRVKKLFKTMRDGSYAEIEFPRLDWDDVPALLEYADNTKMLKAFPRDGASSQFELQCSEGMVALWLIEGLRRGDRYPSGNALCFNAAKAGSDWGKASEDNHKEVANAYRAWHEKTKSLTPEKAKAVNPLDGTGLAWH